MCAASAMRVWHLCQYAHAAIVDVHKDSLEQLVTRLIHVPRILPNVEALHAERQNAHEDRRRHEAVRVLCSLTAVWVLKSNNSRARTSNDHPSTCIATQQMCKNALRAVKRFLQRLDGRCTAHRRLSSSSRAGASSLAQLAQSGWPSPSS